MADELILAGVVTLLIIVDLAFNNKKLIGWLFTLAMAGLLAWVITNRQSGEMLGGSYVYDGLSWFAKIIFLSGAFLTGLMSINNIKGHERHTGAYYAVLASSTLGMMILASSKELITLYVGLELTTVSLYALAAFYKKDNLSLEAGIKYLILGALSSGILLYGLSILYMAAGSTNLDRIMTAAPLYPGAPVFTIAVIMVLLGVGFKLSMVPMHVWTPDVYHGAPTPITGFISVASKAAGFVFAIRLFLYAFKPVDFMWVPLTAVLAFMTMTVGNLVAIPQKNIKRLLAYSTISQAGYLLMGFTAASSSGISSILFYLLAYTVTNLAAFGVVIAVSQATGSDEIDSYSGLAQRSPVLALTLMLALLSLAGIPPLAGFVGKFYLFYAAMQKGYMWLVIAGALNSTVSLYYYLLVLKRMYIFDPSKDYPKINVATGLKVALIICVAAILILGIMPTGVVDTAGRIAAELLNAAAPTGNLALK